MTLQLHTKVAYNKRSLDYLLVLEKLMEKHW